MSKQSFIPATRPAATFPAASPDSVNGNSPTLHSPIAHGAKKIAYRLQDRVIDLEVANNTPSPIIDPSVRTILVAHSMGGIVAADTLLSILDDESVTLSNGRRQRKGTGFMFPYIQGILAFDTPYLGLSPAIFANGTDTHLRSASATVSQISALASGLLASRAASEGATVVQKKKDVKSADAARKRSSSKRRTSRSSSRGSREIVTPPPPAPVAPTGLFGGWGKVAAYAGAAGILAAGGAIAYFKRDELTQGFSWVSSHMEFVGALMKGEELKNRTKRATSVPGVGFATLYTALGEKGQEKGERTFIILPVGNTEHSGLFYRCVNPKVKDEVEAHVSMFSPKTNPWYYEMGQLSRDLIVEWTGGWGEAERRGSPERSSGVGRGERL